MKSIAFGESANSSARPSAYMGQPLGAVGICLDEETSRFIDLFATSSSLISVRAQLGRTRSELDAEFILNQLPPLSADICFVDFDRHRALAISLAERIHARLPETAIFAISSQSQPSAILEAMRCGCNEYLVKPVDREQLTTAVVRIGARRKDKQDQTRAQVLAFLGAKGGCGVTTVVTQMGALLAKSFSRSALLVDLHPDFGDAALYLKLTKSRYHFFELLENTDRLDADLLESFLIRHSSGLEVIPAPEGSVGTGNATSTGALSSTLEFLRGRYEFILVDMPPSLNDDNLTVIRECDQLYLVAVAEVSAVRNVVRQLEYLAQKEIARDKVRVVLNRHHKSNVVNDAQIEKAIDQKIFWRVPNEYPQVVKTIHEGDPIAQLPNSGVARSLERWAGDIGKKAVPESTKKQSSGLLGGLLNW
jgi:pilus assembly protein CpaE